MAVARRRAAGASSGGSVAVATVVVGTPAVVRGISARRSTAGRSTHAGWRSRWLVPWVVTRVGVEGRCRGREARHAVSDEWVIWASQLSADGRRANPRGAALERDAVPLSVDCEVNAGLRRWDSPVERSVEQPRSNSSWGLHVADDEAVVVVTNGDDDVAVHVDTAKRSVNDAACRWQGVSGLPAVVRATRCAGVNFGVDLHAVSGLRRSGRSHDWVVGVAVTAVGVGSPSAGGCILVLLGSRHGV